MCRSSRSAGSRSSAPTNVSVPPPRSTGITEREGTCRVISRTRIAGRSRRDVRGAARTSAVDFFACCVTELRTLPERIPSPAVRLGLVGFGYWGPNYAKSIAAVDGAELTWCADVSPAARARAHELYPQVKVSADASELAAAADCDAAIVAAPTTLHAEIARTFLAAGKPVLVEKPLTDRADT